MRAETLGSLDSAMGVHGIRSDTSSLPSSSLHRAGGGRDARHYGGLRIVIVSRIAEDRLLRCRIRARERSLNYKLIRAKIRSIHISAPRSVRDQIHREICSGFVCGNNIGIILSLLQCAQFF